MKLRNLNIVIAREYLTRVRKKSFLLITFLGPVFFAAVAILPTIIMMMTDDGGKNVAVVDRSGIVMDKLSSNDTFALKGRQFFLVSYLVSENLSDTPKSWVEVGYDEADTTGMLVWWS